MACEDLGLKARSEILSSSIHNRSEQQWVEPGIHMIDQVCVLTESLPQDRAQNRALCLRFSLITAVCLVGKREGFLLSCATLDPRVGIHQPSSI